MKYFTHSTLIKAKAIKMEPLVASFTFNHGLSVCVYVSMNRLLPNAWKPQNSNEVFKGPFKMHTAGSKCVKTVFTLKCC